MESDRIMIPYGVIKNTSIIDDIVNGGKHTPDFITIPRSEIGLCSYLDNSAENGKFYIRMLWRGAQFDLVFMTENAYNKAIEAIGYEGYEPPA